MKGEEQKYGGSHVWAFFLSRAKMGDKNVARQSISGK